MIINHNMMAINANRMANTNLSNASKAMAKLSSGLRINSAADDAAGLAISEKMKGQISGLNQASSNAQNGVSLVQTADGALNETTSVLQRMRELAVQSANDTNTSSDRANIQKEVDQLAQQITNISNTTEFNTKNLLAGGLSSTLQIGANAGQQMGVSISAMDAFSLGVATNAVTASIDTTNTAKLTTVSDAGSGLVGAAQYSVIVTKSAATTFTATAATKGTDTGADGSAAAVDGTYSGVDNANYVIKASSVTGGVVDGIQVSKDGGVTFGSQIAVAGNTATSIGDGLSFTISANTGATNDLNDTWTFNATASSATLQLADSLGTTPIGSAVTVKNSSSSATIGNASTDATVTVGYSFSTLVASATNNTKIDIANVASKAAVTDANGNVAAGGQAVAAAGIDVSTQSAANTAITKIDAATQQVSSQRAILGAYQNRLESTINNLGTASQNLTSAESQITDVDMAATMAEYSKDNVLSQAAQAMLAQANQVPQQVLQLLR